mmetsp:Transcript_222/g.839  ORF Transcript_222/g.839 Transcript_222/m.839 type:complete len:322 (+) Transcript_222:340-1305(+)
MHCCARSLRPPRRQMLPLLLEHHGTPQRRRVAHLGCQGGLFVGRGTAPRAGSRGLAALPPPPKEDTQDGQGREDDKDGNARDEDGGPQRETSPSSACRWEDRLEDGLRLRLVQGLVPEPGLGDVPDVGRGGGARGQQPLPVPDQQVVLRVAEHDLLPEGLHALEGSVDVYCRPPGGRVVGPGDLGPLALPRLRLRVHREGSNGGAHDEGPQGPGLATATAAQPVALQAVPPDHDGCLRSFREVFNHGLRGPLWPFPRPLWLERRADREVGRVQQRGVRDQDVRVPAREVSRRRFGSRAIEAEAYLRAVEPADVVHLVRGHV